LGEHWASSVRLWSALGELWEAWKARELWERRALGGFGALGELWVSFRKLKISMRRLAPCGNDPTLLHGARRWDITWRTSQCGARPQDLALEAPRPESVESNYYGTILETRQPIS